MGYGYTQIIVADQCSKRALVFELVAPPLEQILLGSKHLGMVPEDQYQNIGVLYVRKSFCSVARVTEPPKPTLRL